MRKGRRTFLSLAALLAALGLFAVLVAGIPSSRTENGPASSARAGAAGHATGRQVYSPVISKDPYVVDQWEKSIQALENACRDRGEFCDEARTARISMTR